MEMKTLPIAELRSLLAAVSEHGKQHLVEVDTDLQQTSFLLSEAIEKLSLGFMSIYDAVSQQQVLIEELAEKYHLEVADIEKLAVFKTKVGEEVNGAVTGLQFQDLTSQLITRTIRRVNGLKEILEELSTHSQEIEPHQEHEEIVHYLERMNTSLNAGSHALAGGLQRRTVGQKDMATGEIDLF
jgi:methyl-accepting chemotaxis protein